MSLLFEAMLPNLHDIGLVMSASPVVLELCAANIFLAGVACVMLVFAAFKRMVSKTGDKSAESVP